MGARIEGAGTSTITITGVPRLNGATHAVMPDRIETGTYAVAAAMAGGEVRLTNTRWDFIESLLAKIEQAGAEVIRANDGLTIRRNGARLEAVDIETDPYPGLATDVQAQFMALMTTAKGESVIRETIFENRFMHVPELTRLGADITVHGGEARVRGCHDRLDGAQVMGHRPARLGQPGHRRPGCARRDGGQPRLSPGSRLRASRGKAQRLRGRGPPPTRRRAGRGLSGSWPVTARAPCGCWPRTRKIHAGHLGRPAGRRGQDPATSPMRRQPRQLTVALNRYRWEAGQRTAERVRAALQLGGVLSVKARKLRREAHEAVIELLAIEFEPGEAPGGVVAFHFAGGGDLRCEVECIDAVLADVSTPWPARRAPAHEG